MLVTQNNKRVAKLEGNKILLASTAPHRKDLQRSEDRAQEQWTVLGKWAPWQKENTGQELSHEPVGTSLARIQYLPFIVSDLLRGITQGAPKRTETLNHGSSLSMAVRIKSILHARFSCPPLRQSKPWGWGSPRPACSPPHRCKPPTRVPWTGCSTHTRAQSPPTVQDRCSPPVQIICWKRKGSFCFCYWQDLYESLPPGQIHVCGTTVIVFTVMKLKWHWLCFNISVQLCTCCEYLI